ncbi:MAG: hypothetical protein AAGU75_14735, partial [Bacillota bacterium]
MSGIGNQLRYGLLLLIIEIILILPQTVPAYAFEGVYINPFLYGMDAPSDESDTQEPAAQNSYSQLGFSKIDTDVLSEYINVEQITEKQFYKLNFEMK